MAEKTKKRPEWLGGGDARPTRSVGDDTPSGPDADEERRPKAARRGAAEPAGEGVSRVTIGAGPSPAVAKSSHGLRRAIEDARRKPALLVILATMLLALLVLLYLLLVAPRLGGGPTGSAAPERPAAEGDPGAAIDTGVSFSALEETSEPALRGEGAAAGLEWSGTVIEKGDGAGETVTLSGPTAAQIERGFELEGGDVESSNYAVAQEDGTVLYVGTLTYLPKGGEGTEVTLGSVFDLEGGELREHARYKDERRGGFRVVRTYEPGRGEPYKVSFDSPPGQSTVPFLVGYRGASAPRQGEGR